MSLWMESSGCNKSITEGKGKYGGNFLTLPSLHVDDSLPREWAKGKGVNLGESVNYYIARIIQKVPPG